LLDKIVEILKIQDRWRMEVPKNINKKKKKILQTLLLITVNKSTQGYQLKVR